MTDSLHFSAVKNKLKKILKDENITLPNYFLNNFLNFVSKVCIYEEEGKKIKPQLVLGYNIKKAIEQVPNHEMIPINKGKRSGSDLEKKIKAIIPFCSNGWCVYIDFKSAYIDYGLLRAFSGPKGLSATEIIFENDNIDLDSLDYGLIEIQVISKFEMVIKGLMKNNLIIDFRLIGTERTGNCLEKMVDDIISSISLEEKEIIKKVFTKLLKISTQKIHGAILLVVKYNYRFPNKLLSDGIWLNEPIDLSKKALDAVRDIKDGLSNETFYSLSGLLYEMANVDGITVIDNKGKIRGFNIFMNKSNIKDIQLKDLKHGGGARLRAAMSLLYSKDKNFIGVYFQSQDGYSFYERMNNIG